MFWKKLYTRLLNTKSKRLSKHYFNLSAICTWQNRYKWQLRSECFPVISEISQHTTTHYFARKRCTYKNILSRVLKRDGACATVSHLSRLWYPQILPTEFQLQRNVISTKSAQLCLSVSALFGPEWETKIKTLRQNGASGRGMDDISVCQQCSCRPFKYAILFNVSTLLYFRKQCFAGNEITGNIYLFAA